MKKRVDLGNLLAKYEGNQENYTVNSQLYASRSTHFDKFDNYDQVVQEIHSVPVQRNYTGKFEMSKSQCEQFLAKIREEVRLEERTIKNFAEISMKEIQNRFHANHQKIKRQLLDLLDKSFRDNQRYILDELKIHANSEPQEFQPVQRKIVEIDEEINRLLYGLKSTEYKRSIAEVVVKDFSSEIHILRQTIRNAKQDYLRSLGEVEPDKERIECIRGDLQRLFKISFKNAQLVQKSLFSVFGGGDKIKEHRQSLKPLENSRSVNKNIRGESFLLSPNHKHQNEAYRHSEPPKSFFDFGLF